MFSFFFLLSFALVFIGASCYRVSVVLNLSTNTNFGLGKIYMVTAMGVCVCVVE